ncbi:hypothetical protein PTSG_08966 [Salpingoeca rosetta]|uniref:Uncharacterized protein n=1 Tax=Salpingoeca rosetta (strain ATCC 50818 / BSB-021) TaxID=946362 RepID=F2ULT9_SALR5|nr:uncharacterized protein PTSG_08966 [Salpingoeca rosetta]EGD78088.1 hypothetical protein PTSG_08966 [Salpingoeca rosetta]|eukprot:XP_004989764.1 hypothetical protein PTSG_08966 [Salpingoeca rosetta]
MTSQPSSVPSTDINTSAAPGGLGVHEWACVAQHLLAQQFARINQDREGFDDGEGYCVGRALQEDDVDADLLSARERDGARAVLNLMLSCRTLYNELPWALPKWYLAHLVRTDMLGQRHTCYVSGAWLDTFQWEEEEPQQEEQEEEGGEENDGGKDSDNRREDDKGTKGSTGDPLACDGACGLADPRAATHSISAPPSRNSSSSSMHAWLEDRFLVHSWLGATWVSTCQFLAFSPRTPKFMQAFGRYGRITFRGLSTADIFLWTDGTAQLPRPQHGDENGDGNGDGQLGEGDNGLGDCGTPANNGDERTEEEPLQTFRHKNPAMRPALFMAQAGVEDQASLNEVMRRIETLQEQHKCTCDRLFLCTHGPLDHVRVRDARHVHIECADDAVIDSVELHNVVELHWHLAADQRYLRGTLDNVRKVKVFGDEEQSISDINALANVSDVTLMRLDNVSAGPLAHARRVVLYQVELASGAVCLQDVDHLELHRCQGIDSDFTCNARAFKLDGGMQLNIKLPHATRVHLSNTDTTHLDLGFEALDVLALHRCDQLQTLPAFGRVDVLSLSFVTGLDAALLRSLNGRVRTLIINAAHDPTFDLSLLENVSADVRVEVAADGCNIRRPLPACVQAVNVDTLSAQHVPDVAVASRLQVAFETAHNKLAQPTMALLCNHEHVQMYGCAMEGQVHGVGQLGLCGCEGAVSVQGADFVKVDEGALTLTLADVRRARLIAIEHVRVPSTSNVTTCVLDGCQIEDWSGFAGVRRLIVNACVFDNVDTLPLTAAPFTFQMRGECKTITTNKVWPEFTVIFQEGDDADDVRRELNESAVDDEEGDVHDGEEEEEGNGEGRLVYVDDDDERVEE